jgi:PAS domain S-box-containing protein
LGNISVFYNRFPFQNCAVLIFAEISKIHILEEYYTGCRTTFYSGYIISMLKNIASLLNMSEDEIRSHPHLLINAFDKEHRVLFWNDRCEKYFGITEREALGKTLEDLIPYTRENKKMVYLKKALSGHPVYVADDRYDKKSGVYDQVVLPLKNDSGEVFGAVNIVIDLAVMKSGGNRKFSFLQ